jgi:DNA-nicking Smr family endonuclease
MSGDRERRGGNDHALWEAVKKTIAPLKKAAKPSGEHRGEKASPAIRPQQPKPAAPPPPLSIPDLPPLAPLDRRARQKIARGRRDIEARIDLHGMKQNEAKERLLAFLHRAQARGKSLVLVITGKGTFAP